MHAFASYILTVLHIWQQSQYSIPLLMETNFAMYYADLRTDSAAISFTSKSILWISPAVESHKFGWCMGNLTSFLYFHVGAFYCLLIYIHRRFLRNKIFRNTAPQSSHENISGLAHWIDFNLSEQGLSAGISPPICTNVRAAGGRSIGILTSHCRRAVGSPTN